MPRLLQACNVGSITGGTAACAWSVTRSLTDWDHRVICFTRVTPEMRRVFHPVPVYEATSLDLDTAAGCNIALLHNTAANRVGRLSIPTVVYKHSRTPVAAGDLHVACSRWLAGQIRGGPVLWQGASRPGCRRTIRNTLREQIVIGRLCTPLPRKWPRESLGLLADIARQFPQARFELVGCPHEQRRAYVGATRSRVRFIPPGWSARDRLAEWDALLYINPNVTESFGRVAAEAMLGGCIPIVDRRGGFVEQLDAGGGFLCARPDDCLKAVALLADVHRRRRISRISSAIGHERFSLPAFRARLLRRFHEASVAFCRQRGIEHESLLPRTRRGAA